MVYLKKHITIYFDLEHIHPKIYHVAHFCSHVQFKID